MCYIFLLITEFFIKMKALIFAAGFGTRLKPLTLYKPKALVEVRNKPILFLIIQKLKLAGFNHIVINVHHFAEQIIQYVKKNDSFGIKIDFSDETNELLDTGGGLVKARNIFGETDDLLLYNVDIISDIDLNKFYNYHKKNKALATLATKQRETTRSLLINEHNYLSGWRNIQTNDEIICNDNKNLREIAFSGIHFVNRKIFSLLNKKSKFPIMPEYLRIAKTEKIKTYEHNNDFWFEIGKLENLINFSKIDEASRN